MEDSTSDPFNEIVQHTIEQDLVLWKTTANLIEIDKALENRSKPGLLSNGELAFCNTFLRRIQNYFSNLFTNFRNGDHR